MAESSRTGRKRKHIPRSNPISHRDSTEFNRTHFPTAPLAKRFQTRFMGRKVLDSYLVELDAFGELLVCNRSVRDMLLPWKSALELDEMVYPNLVRVFYSNMELSAERVDRIVTHVGGIPIEFDYDDLNDILGIPSDGHEIYTSRKELSFDDFSHHPAVRNICRRRDLSDEICSLPFRAQLLPLRVRILHIILQHIVTPRKGHADEVTRLDVGILDSLLSGRPLNLGYIILRHMLSTPGVSHRLLPYGSIITRILFHFRVPIRDSMYLETKKIGGEAISAIGFSRRGRTWIKTPSAKNQDTLVAPEDIRFLNDIFTSEELPDFRLGARPPPPRRESVSQPPVDHDTEEPEMETDRPSASATPPAPDSLLQQLVGDVRAISVQQQLLQDQFASFQIQQQRIFDQQQRIITALGIPPSSSSSPPPQ